MVSNPVDMIRLLAETRPLTGHISFPMVLSGLDLYDAATVLSVLRCLCKNGLVDPEDFFLHITQVRSLTTLWDAKELEEMTRTARRRPISSGLSQAQKRNAHGRRRLRGLDHADP